MVTMNTPTEPEPAPAQTAPCTCPEFESFGHEPGCPMLEQLAAARKAAPRTAREWVELALKNWNDYDGADWPACMTDEDAYELADMHDAQKDRADRAEAEAKRLNTLVAEKESVITAWMDKLSGQISARMSAEAERDRLREAAGNLIKIVMIPDLQMDEHWAVHQLKTGHIRALRAALNQTTNEK